MIIRGRKFAHSFVLFLFSFSFPHTIHGCPCSEIDSDYDEASLALKTNVTGLQMWCNGSWAVASGVSGEKKRELVLEKGERKSHLFWKKKGVAAIRVAVVLLLRTPDYCASVRGCSVERCFTHFFEI